eukprot:CAMPEP_0204316644 /NCGR_PEP_ID=MMETSP0469-20131031/5514_1 /ASSEMBLY_ACC=CAM_ASM_000384 /TAXON_ID=2969 /ORGANISM="Oxyrrhis marina" /LENGTH=646 /DNA_ID=CAMNT_0051297445 /DNA_START=57 /DNA_END=1997 /DNA_ORIENTATION=+
MKFQQKQQAQAASQEPVEDKAASLREAIQVLAVNRCPVQVQGRSAISSIELQKVGKEWYGGVLRRVDSSTWEWNPQWTGGVVHVGDNGKSVEVPCYSPELAAERASLLVVAAALALGIPPSEAKLMVPAQAFLRRAAEMKNKANGAQNASHPAKVAPSKFAPKASPKAAEPPTKKPKTSSGADPVLVSARHEHKQLQQKLNRQQPVDLQHVTGILTRLTKQVNACLGAANTTADKASARHLLVTLMGLQGQCQDPKKQAMVARNVMNSLGAWIVKRDQNGATPLVSTGKAAISAAAKAAVAVAKASKVQPSAVAAKAAVAKALSKAPSKAPKVHVIKSGARLPWAKAVVQPAKAAATPGKPGRGKVLYSSKWNKIPVVKSDHKLQPAKFQTFSPFFPKQPAGKAAATKAALLAKAPAAKHFPKAPAAKVQPSGGKGTHQAAKPVQPAAPAKFGKGGYQAAKPVQPAAPAKFGKGGYQAAKPHVVIAGKGGKGLYQPAKSVPAAPAKFGKGLVLPGKAAAPVHFGKGQAEKPAPPPKAWQKGAGKGQPQRSASAPLVGMAQSKGQHGLGLGAGGKAGGKGFFPAPAVGALPRASSTPVVIKGAGKLGGKGQKKVEWHAPVGHHAGGKGKGRGHGKPAVDVGQFFMNR